MENERFADSPLFHNFEVKLLGKVAKLRAVRVRG
jgi:hypothetical protein